MMYSLGFIFPKEVPFRNPRDSQTQNQDRTTALGRFQHFCQSQLGEGEFLGLSEGVLLAEEAHERGYETESWVLDAGEAPHERDWLGQEPEQNIVAYFQTLASAQRAARWLGDQFLFAAQPRVIEEPEQDWNATWKASFRGIDVSEHLKVLPPWHEDLAQQPEALIINPGAGFGTGTHETTQMCLQLLEQFHHEKPLQGLTVLDFGSGSGILGILAAKWGARVTCVEVDRLANENAVENARLNQVSSNIRFLEEIPDDLVGQVDVLLANILRPILIQFAPQILRCLKPKSELILSGLIESDLDQVIRTYRGLEGSVSLEIEKFEKNEWRALRCRRRT